MRLTPAQIGMYALLGHRLPFAMPEEWTVADIIRHGRESLTADTGVDFGYDPEAWHAHLVATGAGGYKWSNKHRGFPRQIEQAVASLEWQMAVASLRNEKQAKPEVPTTGKGRQMTEAFTFFWKGPLSQWQRSPFVVGGVSFTHAEQSMMYAKARLFGDREAADRILQAATPREQQDIGRTVRGFDETVWVLFREGIVYQANYARFSQNSEQRELLFATRGTTLVEASPHDQVWGIGLAADDPLAMDRSKWRGLNLLGQALTQVREVLLWEQSLGQKG